MVRTSGLRSYEDAGYHRYPSARRRPTGRLHYRKATMTTTEEKRPALRRAITGPLLFLFILGDTLGAGVYALIGSIAGEVGGAVWVPMLLALGMALLTASSYAELVTKYPKAGGAAVFAERAFKKPIISFLVGFSMLAAGLTSAAALSLAFGGDYLGTFIDVPPTVAAIVFLALVAAVNARGIKESVGANMVMTVIETSGLLLVIVLVAILLAGGGGEPARVVEFKPDVNPLAATFGAAIIAFYSFVGFEVSANVAEEVRNPSKIYPKALFGALITAGVVYLFIGIASTATLSPAALGESSAPLLDVVKATGVAIPPEVFSLIALIAVSNGALLAMIMSSRLAYGMAETGLLPSVLGTVLPRRRTPWVAILATTAVAMLLTLSGGVEVLAETVVLLLLFVFLSVNTAVLVLRRDRVAHSHFRTPKALPYLAIVACIVLLSQQSGEVWLRGLLLIGVGVVLYGITAATRSKRNARR
jgi:basic amino acid/polyamine antiporter, APA family